MDEEQRRQRAIDLSQQSADRATCCANFLFAPAT